MDTDLCASVVVWVWVLTVWFVLRRDRGPVGVSRRLTQPQGAVLEANGDGVEGVTLAAVAVCFALVACTHRLEKVAARWVIGGGDADARALRWRDCGHLGCAVDGWPDQPEVDVVRVGHACGDSGCRRRRRRGWSCVVLRQRLFARRRRHQHLELLFGGVLARLVREAAQHVGGQEEALARPAAVVVSRRVADALALLITQAGALAVARGETGCRGVVAVGAAAVARVDLAGLRAAAAERLAARQGEDLEAAFGFVLGVAQIEDGAAVDHVVEENRLHVAWRHSCWPQGGGRGDDSS